MTKEYFAIDSDRLTSIAAAAGVSEDTVRGILLADWPEGHEHQAWLDIAPVREIAAWVREIAAWVRQDPEAQR